MKKKTVFDPIDLQLETFNNALDKDVYMCIEWAKWKRSYLEYVVASESAYSKKFTQMLCLHAKFLLLEKCLNYSKNRSRKKKHNKITIASGKASYDMKKYGKVWIIGNTKQIMHYSNST